MGEPIWIYGMSSQRKYDFIYNNLINKDPHIINYNLKDSITSIINRVVAVVESPSFIWKSQNWMTVQREMPDGSKPDIFLFRVHFINFIDPITYNSITKIRYDYCNIDCLSDIRILKINTILAE
jgi:hypothetical protein